MSGSSELSYEAANTPTAKAAIIVVVRINTVEVENGFFFCIGTPFRTGNPFLMEHYVHCVHGTGIKRVHYTAKRKKMQVFPRIFTANLQVAHFPVRFIHCGQTIFCHRTRKERRIPFSEHRRSPYRWMGCSIGERRLFVPRILLHQTNLFPFCKRFGRQFCHE